MRAALQSRWTNSARALGFGDYPVGAASFTQQDMIGSLNPGDVVKQILKQFQFRLTEALTGLCSDIDGAVVFHQHQVTIFGKGVF